jgi:tetratricopeptide (TPR) repeat protein
VHARGVGDPDLARTLFQRCIEIVDRNPRAGGVKSRSGEKEGRENALGSVFHALAMLEKEAGDTDAARAAFTSATEAAPRYSYAWQSWGLLEKEVGDVDKARKYLSMSAAYTAPGQAAVPCWHALGRLEEEEGDTKAARTCYQRGLEVAPRSSVLWSCLGSLEAASGNSESARHCFSTAVKVDPKGSVTLGVVKLWAETEQEMDSASGAEAGRSAIKRLVSLGGGAERGVSPAAGSVAPIVVPTHASASQFAAAAAAMASRASAGPGSKDNRWLVTAWAEYEAACGNKDEAKALRERAAQA